jgi:hypothetical protein
MYFLRQKLIYKIKTERIKLMINVMKTGINLLYLLLNCVNHESRSNLPILS